jgi:putative DNA methylase
MSPPPESPDNRHLTAGFHHRDHLPHLKREGASYFVTFRLAGTLPATVLAELKHERDLIQAQALAAKRPLTWMEQEELFRWYATRVDAFLDAGHGECWLQRREIAELVAASLRHFQLPVGQAFQPAGARTFQSGRNARSRPSADSADKERATGKSPEPADRNVCPTSAEFRGRYELLAWVVMPNHVHAVVRPLPGHTLSQILKSWKGFSAREANRLLGRDGEFWQGESYDHLIRDDEDMHRCCHYTTMNPVNARFCERPEDWPWSSAYRVAS